MTAIAEFSSKQGVRVCGNYRVLGFFRCAHGNHYRLVLGDHTGDCSVLPSDDNDALAEWAQAKQVVYAEITPKPLTALMGGTAHVLAPLNDSTLNNAARLIPVSNTTEVVKTAVQQLVALIDDLTLPETRQFVNAVVAEHYNGLLRARGAWQYHHAYEGGLMVHTVNVMRRTLATGSTIYIEDRPRVELMVLGALLHDLGKVQTHIRGDWNPGLRHLRHEQFSVALAAPHLLQLQEKLPEGAEHLSKILNWLCSTPEWRRRNPCQDAELIHNMDVHDVWADRANDGALLPLAS